MKTNLVNAMRFRLKPHHAPKYLKTKGDIIKDKISSIVDEGSRRRIIVKKGNRTVFKIPFTVGLGSATAAILMNASLTAVAAIVALSNDISIKIQDEADNKSNS